MLNSKKHILFNTLSLTIVLLVVSILSTMASDQKLADDLFKKGNYTEAMPLFKELNLIYPNDTYFQYAYGACLTETGHIGQQAKKLLLQASQSTVPGNVFFYIGKNYHGMKDFETALNYYHRFAEQASKKEKKATAVESLIEECQQQKVSFEIQKEQDALVRPASLLQEKFVPMVETDSVFTNTEPTIPIIQTEGHKVQTKISTDSLTEPTVDVVDSITSIKPTFNIEQTKQTDTISIQIPDVLAQSECSVDFRDTVFNFTLTAAIWYRKINQFRTPEGRKYFIEGWNHALELDTILRRIQLLREDYENAADENIKSSIASQVLDLEQQSMQIKDLSDAAYLQSNLAEISYWKTASNEQIKKLKTENDSIAASLIAQKEPTAIANNEPIVMPETVQEIRTDSILSETIAENPVVQEDINVIIYRIQIGSYSNDLPDYIDRLYKKLSVLRKIDNYTDENGITVYTIGEVSNLDDAIKLQTQIRQEGVKDAFVVAYNNGKRITLKEAKELTKK